MSQTFHMARFKEYREKGLSAYNAGTWNDARFNLLKAAEHLYKLASASEGRIREERLRGAGRLKTLAESIDPAAPPPRTRRATKEALATGNGRGGAAPRGGGEGEGDAAADSASQFVACERPGVKFDDLAGLDDVKEQVRLKLVYPFLHADKARRYGIQAGGGVLLYGPPGTGKTLMARAIAGEIDAAFFAVRPSEVLSKWVGDSERNVEALFREARRHPVSVIFIDEIEALLPARRASKEQNVMQRVVPQILAELEGFRSAEENPLLFLGATNEPWALDPAVLRPGRFDEKIYVGLPDLPARVRMLEIFLKERPLGDDVDVAALADALTGYSGADIRGLCNKAASEAFLQSVEGGGDALIDRALFARLMEEVRPSVSAKDLERFEAYGKA